MSALGAARARPRPWRRARTGRAMALLLMAGCGRPPSSGSTMDAPMSFSLTPVPGGQTPEQFVDVPENAVSVTLLVEGGPLDTLGLGVRDAARRVLIDATAPEESTNRMLRGVGAAAAMLPSATSALPLGPRYAVRAFLFPAGGGDTLGFTAFVKRSAEGPRFTAARRAPAVQGLRSAVFLVGDKVEDDITLLTALAEAGRILRAAGIEMEEPPRRRLSGGDFDLYARRVLVNPALGPDSLEVADLLRAAPEEEGLRIFVVYDLSAQSGQQLAGLTASVPVPPVSGGPRSGLLVNSAYIEARPNFGGQILAHEIGHALGLFHTTEADGRHTDTIDDTPSCDPGVDTNHDGVLSAEECDLYDGPNLMFWAPVAGSDRLTEGQGEIMRRAPLAR